MLFSMTFVLAHSRSAPAFNGLFYATAATIIPVLYLAIAIQGSIYRDLLNSVRAGRLPAIWVTSGILIYGTMGEIWALVSLYEQRAEGAWGFVLLSAIFLVLVTAAGPCVALGKAMRAEPRPPEPGSSRANWTPQTTAQPDPSPPNGKTDN